MCFIKIHYCDSYDQNEAYGSIKIYPKITRMINYPCSCLLIHKQKIICVEHHLHNSVRIINQWSLLIKKNKNKSMIHIISFKIEWLISMIHIFFSQKRKQNKKKCLGMLCTSLESTKKVCLRRVSLNELCFGMKHLDIHAQH